MNNSFYYDNYLLRIMVVLITNTLFYETRYTQGIKSVHRDKLSDLISE